MPDFTKENYNQKNRTLIIICSIILVCLVLSPFIFLFNKNPGFGKVLIVFIFAPVLGYLFYLVFYSGPTFLLLFLTKKSKSKNPEIADMENCYHATTKRLVIKRLGLWAYLKFSGGINRGLNSGYDYCKDLLQTEKVKTDGNLRFFVLIQLYESSLFDGHYNQALDHLKQAQELKPHDFLVRYWMAETTELIGHAEKAIVIYQNIMTDFSDISESLKEYINKKIEHIKIAGPKKPSPMPGLKYMSY